MISRMELEFSGITLAELVNWKETQETVVLIDCRSSLEYGTSHIVDAVSIGASRANRREIMNGKVRLRELLQQKWAILQQEKLSENTENSAQIIIEKLDSEVKVVIYDQNSMVVNNQHSLIYQLLINLQSEFTNVFFLKGGFMGFQSQHPAHCWTSEHKQPDEDFVPHHQHKEYFNLSYSSMDVTATHNPLVSSSANSSSNNSRSGSKLHLDIDFSNIPGPSSSKIVKSLSYYPRRRPEQLPSLSSALPGPSISSSHYPGSLSGPALSSMPVSSRDYSGSKSGSSRVPTPVMPHLILGSQQDALSQQLLQQYGITHIINVSTDGLQSPYIPTENFLRIPILDNFCDTITNYFPAAFEFLNKVKSSGGRALVHCSAGISRSPTIAIAYLMKVNSISVTEAYEIVKAIRPSISPNFNFMGQLTSYESELAGTHSQRLKPSPSMPKLSKKKHKSSLSSSTSSGSDLHTRPKRRPSRLGFLSSLMRPSLKANNLLPSPSRPFSNLGLNSPLTSPSSPPHKLLLTAPGPRHYPSPSLQFKVTRNPASTADHPPSSETTTMATTTSSSCALKRRLISLYAPPSSSNIITTTTTTVSGCNDDSSFMLLCESPSTPPPPHRSLSIDRIDKQNQQQNQTDNSNGAGSGGVLTDSCRLQETHQSTSSLSSANSHSSSLLAN